jgi:hypothetical protein
MIRGLFYGSLVVSAGALALGFIRLGLWPAALVFALLAGVWAWTYTRQYLQAAHSVSDVASLMLAAWCAGILAGGYLKVEPGWLLAAVVTALAAWDLDAFTGRLAVVPYIADRPGIEKRHLLRLAEVCGAGLALGTLGLVVQVRWTFGAALGLGLVAVLALTQVVAFLRKSRVENRESKEEGEK